MKKFPAMLLAAVLIFAMLIPAFAAGSSAALIDGDWKILVSKDDIIQVNYSAKKIQSVLSEALGKTLPIVNSASSRYIAIGSAAKCDVSGVADNGYRITVKDGSVQINGTGARGVVAAAYRFLEEFAGRKLYTSTMTVLPKTESITVPADTDITYEPFFEYTDTDWFSPCDAEYSLANGLNGSPYRTLSPEQGGTVDYISGFTHTLTNQFCTGNKYFESHPEYFAFREGERTPKQLCLTNPEVVETVKKEVLDLLAEKHDPNASLQIVSLTQNDNFDYCECENCKSFEALHGNVQSATMINFVNQIADAVAEKGYDNVAIDTFAYQYTRKAPTGIVPRSNVIVRLCTIECCFCHTLDDPSCESNVELMKDLSDWSEICSRIYVWDYVVNFAQTACVFPNFGVIQRNLQIFYENNVRGVYEEGAYYMYNCNVEFGELRSYMISKCLQNPYCDLDSEVNGFLEAYYGPGGKYIGEAVDMFAAHAGNRDGHLGIFQNAEECLTLRDFQMYQIDNLFKKAMAAAATDGQKANIERSEISWKWYKADSQRGEFSLTNPNRFKEKQKLYDLLIKYDTHMLSEWQEYDDFRDCFAVRFVFPDEWWMYEADEQGARTTAFFGSILELIIPLLTGFGTLYKIYRLIGSIHFDR